MITAQICDSQWNPDKSNKVPRDWENVFTILQAHSVLFSIHFTITELKNVVRYIRLSLACVADVIIYNAGIYEG